MVKLVECPRDAWQGLPHPIPAEIKADYLRVLIAAGFKHIDAVSFVAKTLVPQMADSELVLEYLDPPDDVEIIGLCGNEHGAERAVKTGAIATLGVSYSVSPTYLNRSQNQTPEEALEALETIGTVAYKAGLETAASLSMAFGNSFGDAWSVAEVVDACDLLVDCGVTQISLVDTAGAATPALLTEVVAAVLAEHSAMELGVHLRARPGSAATLVRAAYSAGCRRFDSVIGGLGVCAFTDDSLAGNLATETLLAELQALGAELPELRPLEGLHAASLEIERKYGAKLQ